MKKLLGVTLGIVAALGGFVDIGDVVFASQAGAQFGYSLLWALVVGTGGIIVYSEMSGRVAAVVKKPVFQLIGENYPQKLGFTTLAASKLLNLLTCAAEIGGVALVLKLLSGYSYNLLIVVAALAIIAIVWFLPFSNLEKLFGYLGVGLVIFLIAAVKTMPGISEVAHGLVPQGLDTEDFWNYCYFAVGLIAATLMPYEVYFYSSGGIEEGWKPKDIPMNRANSILGFSLGGLVAAGIMVVAANVFMPLSINPEFIGTSALAVVVSFGEIGLLIALLGLLFAFAGSAMEAAFAGAYNLSQYAGWKWGRHSPPLEAPRFTLSWVIILILSAGVVLTGIDPIALTEYAVLLAVVIMPLTYYPIFKAARNKKLMGKYANGHVANIFGWVYLVIIGLVSLAAVPLLILTSRGTL
jgi:manganese transport protein